MKTKLIFVLDASGSMSNIRNKVVEKYNQLLQECRINSKKVKQYTEVSLYSFDTFVKTIYRNRNINSIKGGLLPEYQIGGYTALFDATGQAIDDEVGTVDYNDENVAYLVIVITDGDENSSSKYYKNNDYSKNQKIHELLKKVDRTGRWTVTFQVPRGGKDTLVNQFSIYSDNIIEWDATDKGVEKAYTQTSLGLSNYYNDRKLGLTSTRGFYATTDLSQVTKSDLRQLNDLSKQFMLLDVKKEQEIKEFVENQTGWPYRKGMAYYQLMKVETVQENKDVLLREKTNGKIYGGSDARSLIGIPDNTRVKVNPGNHANYDVFIQSRSHNRILSRGTKILVQK